MYMRFAENYAKTLDTLVKQSKAYRRNKAKDRQNMGQNDDVDNIAGRERHHFLMQQMREKSSWQLHLERLKKELEVQEDKWDHREEEKAEIEKKRAEIKRLEEEAERERSLERRKKISIIREE